MQANGIPVVALFDTGAGMSIMSSKFFRSIVNKPKVFKYNKKVRSAGVDTLVPIGECYVELKIGKRVLKDRVIIIKYLNKDYIIVVAIQHANKMLTGFSMLGRHFISLNGEMIVQSVSLITTHPILKCKSRTCLKAYAVTFITVQTPPNLDPYKLYECGEKLQLPEGVITLEVQHKFNHKMPLELKIPLLNTNKRDVCITKNTTIVTLQATNKVQDICSFQWRKWDDTQETVMPEAAHPEETKHSHKGLLPPMPETSLQIEANKEDHQRVKMLEAYVPEEAKEKLKTLLKGDYNDIVSKSATDIGRTNLIELDIPTEGPCVSCWPYSIPLKYRDFVDEEIQQLEEMQVSYPGPCPTGPTQSKKPTPQDPKSPNKKQFNLRLCINYRKLNSQIITARQVKSNGTLGKVVASYPLPTIDTLLARFKDCKYFSTLDLKSGYYHIKLTKETSAKTAFVTDKGKWQSHSLPFRINLGPSAFSYVLGTTLPGICTKLPG